MTEIAELKKIPLPIESFILQWGDLGGQWGVNRSVSQIHAFLYLAEQPLTAEDIADALGMARSNVSNSLKELMVWDLIHRVPLKGDRRDHFEAETDVWEIASRIAAGRKEREIDPALKTLRSVVQEANADTAISAAQRKKLQAMLDFTEQANRFYSQMQSISQPKREAIFKLGAKIVAFLPSGKGGT